MYCVGIHTTMKIAQSLSEALRKFVGSLERVRESKDSKRLASRNGEQTLDSARGNFSLATTGTCDDNNRPGVALDRCVLLLTQFEL
jgi:hypothetical protein